MEQGMALRKIVTIKEEDLLRRKSKEVTVFDSRLKELVADMEETMIKEDGAGLAAPQIGILKRVIICLIDGKVIELINPVIIRAEGQIEDVEGCLSIPGKKGNVIRPALVTVTAFNKEGKPIKITGKEYGARVLCHEIDHLNGILYTDKAVKVFDV
jgi:peptide deformylase